MPLATNALVSIEEARAFLRLDGTAKDDVVTDLINRATSYCEGYCGRPLKARAFADVRLPAQVDYKLRPVAVPIDVTAAVSVTVAGVAQTVWRTEADGDRTLKDVIVDADVTDPLWRPNHFYRAAGWGAWTAGDPTPIKLSYTGGFATVPGELKDACYLVIEHLWRAQEKRQADVQQLGAGPVSPPVTYGPGLVPLAAKYTLDRYRGVFLG